MGEPISGGIVHPGERGLNERLTESGARSDRSLWMRIGKGLTDWSGDRSPRYQTGGSADTKGTQPQTNKWHTLPGSRPLLVSPIVLGHQQIQTKSKAGKASIQPRVESRLPARLPPPLRQMDNPPVALPLCSLRSVVPGAGALASSYHNDLLASRLNSQTTILSGHAVQRAAPVPATVGRSPRSHFCSKHLFTFSMGGSPFGSPTYVRMDRHCASRNETY